MFKIINYILISTFILFTSLNAEIIKEVIIDGNKRISDETIKVYGDININQDYTENDVNQILNNL